MSDFPLSYAVVVESGMHHVVVRRRETPQWLQVIASFRSKDRAQSYADIENDMRDDWSCWGDDVLIGPPAVEEPPSALPKFIGAARLSEHREHVAREEGREEGVKAVLQAVAAKPAVEPPSAAEPVKIAAQPAPPAPVAPQPKPTPEPIRQPPGRPAQPEPGARAIAVERIKKTVLADLDALMKEFPRGPTTGEIQLRFRGDPYDRISEALRKGHAERLFLYEPDGVARAGKCVRPIGWRAPEAEPAPTPAPVRADIAADAASAVDAGPQNAPLADRVLAHLIAEFDRHGPFSLPQIAKEVGESLVETRVACEALDAAGLAKFVTIDRALGRQLVPIGWEPPIISSPSNEAAKVSPAAHALADFQRERTKPKLPIATVEKRAAFGSAAAVSLNYKPDAPAERRGVDILTADLCGDPPPNRSALAQKQSAAVAPPPRRMRDEPISIEDYLTGGN